jgi:hypothetical protein
MAKKYNARQADVAYFLDRDEENSVQPDANECRKCQVPVGDKIEYCSMGRCLRQEMFDLIEKPIRLGG